MQSNKNPKISIIVPVYNMEEFLTDCINSILHQTYEDFELILIDDGSKDRSLEICNEFAQIDSRIVVLHKENGGQGSARNLGLDNCQGEYICFVDSDDTVEDNYLELLLFNAEVNCADISCARMYYAKDKSDVVKDSRVEILDNLASINYFLENKNGLDQASVVKLYKRNVFIATGAKIIENVRIANDVAIGANAVVVKDILEPGTTWAGILAKKVSEHGSEKYILQSK